MNDNYYLYALTRSGYQAGHLGAGVDSRFLVEIVPCKKTAGVASRVGLDKFDVKKLESGQTDINWLAQVAVRHNQVVSSAAEGQPLLPLRLGALFHSRISLLARMESWESAVIDYLNYIGDRQEWAAKIYVDPRHREENLSSSNSSCSNQTADVGNGAEYLAQKLKQRRESRGLQQSFQAAIEAIENSLASQADRYCRSRPLPAALTGREEKMLWNSAFLLRRSASDRWLELVEDLRCAAASARLLLEVSGPWPPYHFCPSLET